MNRHLRHAPVGQEERFRSGLVLAKLDDGQSKTIANIVLGGPLDDTTQRLYIIPRYVFMKDHILSNYVGISKSRVSRLQEAPYVGQGILFTTKDVGSYIINKCEPEMKGHNLYEATPMGNLCIEFYYTGIISNERIRRFYCASLPDLHVPYQVLEVNVPNVPYFFAIRATVNLGQYKPNQLPEECHPTFEVKFHQIMFPCPKLWMDNDNNLWQFDEAMHTVQTTPWNSRRILPDPNPLYANMILPFGKENRRIVSSCIILSPYEVFCSDKPNNKAIIAFIYCEDYLFIEGRTIWGQLYYCRYNEAYILYKYVMNFVPDPKKYPEEYEGPDKCSNDDLHASEENPMQTRMKDGYKEFLGYIKLNRLGHFFCTYAIRLVSDPRKVTHGRFQLGDRKEPEYEKERKQMVGTRAWLRYHPNKKSIKWEVSEMFEGKGEKKSKIEHKSFISLGLKLNKKKGLVYCPSVCNFPLHLVENLMNDDQLDVGDWFRFEGKFNDSHQCYEIFRIIEMVTRHKYPVMRLAGQQDVYAFKIPLYSNYHYTRNLLMDDEIGFIEDIDCKFTMFIAKWEETHRTKDQKGNYNHCHVDVWCRYNPNLADRQMPLCCVDITSPAGVPYPEPK